LSGSNVVSEQIDVEVYAAYIDNNVVEVIGTRVKEDYDDVVEEREMR
jgi:hypothetical protein